MCARRRKGSQGRGWKRRGEEKKEEGEEGNITLEEKGGIEAENEKNWIEKT